MTDETSTFVQFQLLCEKCFSNKTVFSRSMNVVCYKHVLEWLEMQVTLVLS